MNRLVENDPDLAEVVVSNSGFSPSVVRGYFWSIESAELSRLGGAIGKNTHLRCLDFRGNELTNIFAEEDRTLFFKGIKRNASIHYLTMWRCDLSEGVGREILNEFVANNDNLTTITLYGCDLGSGGARVLTSATKNCANLNGINLLSCRINDDILHDIVHGIRGLPQLDVLGLVLNNIGRAGCEALATMLQGPNCNLTTLDLQANNRIDDKCAKILANSLRNNNKLKFLKLQDSGITEKGREHFSQVVCDTSSVNSTYLSNHTLEGLGGPKQQRFIELNKGADKKQVAIRKILLHHPHIDMDPFFEWDLKMLPFVVSWIDRASCHAENENEEPSTPARKLNTIYQFARSMSFMFVP